jgi:hypothetical protein
MKREPVSLAEFKKLHRIPEELPLLGYIIHRLDTDEFLYFYQDSPYSTLCGWSRIPMLAILYDDDKQAIKLVDEELESPCIVSLLFDSKDSLRSHVFPYYIPERAEPFVEKVFRSAP